MRRPSPQSGEILGYNTWGQVSGFFDGDGGVRLRVGSRTIHLILNWTDKKVAQVEQVSDFLRVHGMGSWNKIHLTGSTGAHTLFVTRKEDVLKISKLMMPLCFKRKDELSVVVDHLEDRITVNEVLLTFNKRTLGIARAKCMS